MRHGRYPGRTIAYLSPSQEPEIVSITIEDRSFLVPKDEVLLACIQDIVSSKTPVLGRFC